MSPAADRGVRHPSEVDLLRYEAHALDRDAVRWIRSHLVECERCAATAEALRERSRAVSGWIAEIPVALPDPGKRALALAAIERAASRPPARPRYLTPMLRVAAMVVVLLGVTFGTSRGREWAGDQTLRLAGPNPSGAAGALLVLLGRGDPRPTTAAAGAVPAPDLVVAPAPASPELARARKVTPPPIVMRPAPFRFSPPANEVRLQFDSRQRAGSATLWIRNVSTATAVIEKGSRGESLIVVKDGLRIDNSPRSRADYTIVVPARIQLLRVKVGKEPEMLIRVGRSKREWIWTINLEGSALR